MFSFKKLILAASISAAMLTPAAFAAPVPQSNSQGEEHMNFKRLIEAQIIPGETKVQIAEIDVDPAKIEEFREIVWKVGEISTETEPGVLLLFGASAKDNPARFVVVEIYNDQKAYESHIKTAHFLEYKKASTPLVKSLKLVQYDALCTQVKGNQK